MIQKKEFIRHLENSIIEKMQMLQNEIGQLRLDISSDSKSTAGDKHETSRAMAQLEMEKLGNQSLDYQKQLQWIRQLEHFQNEQTDKVKAGSLIQLTNGWYFLGLGLGKITFENNVVFCISIQSPIGQQLLNKKIGQEINLPNLNLKIVDVS